MDKKLYNYLLVSTILTLITSALCLDWYLFWHQPSAKNSAIITQVTIHPGDSTRKIYNSLKDTHLFSRPYYLKIYLYYQSLFKYIKYGDYLINPQQSPTDIIQQILNGQVRLYSFTIIPGTTWKQLQENINSSSIIQKILTTSSIKDFCRKHNIPSLEGWLAPDSYFISRGTTDKAFIAMAIQQQKKNLIKISQSQPCTLDLHDTVTLASIIEKESSRVDEYSLISSTYINRLKKGMKLQSDPTVRYGSTTTGERLYYFDLEIEHPYNTYKHRGLPPSAISYPSKKALDAACHPQKSDFLFFVAEPKNQYHIFTKTYSEHLNVQKSFK